MPTLQQEDRIRVGNGAALPLKARRVSGGPPQDADRCGLAVPAKPQHSAETQALTFPVYGSPRGRLAATPKVAPQPAEEATKAPTRPTREAKATSFEGGGCKARVRARGGPPSCKARPGHQAQQEQCHRGPRHRKPGNSGHGWHPCIGRASGRPPCGAPRQQCGQLADCHWAGFGF